MESADNRQQSPQADRQEESSNSSSLSKKETIKLLNESIDRLESTIKALGKNSVKDLPSPDSINSLLSTTKELADSVTIPIPEVVEGEATVVAGKTETNPVTQEKPVVTKNTSPPETAQKPPVNFPNNQKKPQEIVAKNPKQENQGLRIIGAIAIVIAIVAVIWLFLPQIKTTISSISESEEIISSRQIPSQSPTSDIPSSNPSVFPETPATKEIPLSSESQTLEPESDSSIETSIPQDLQAPGRATNIKIETIEPELTFTPEQTLIAALQAKLAEIANSYDSNLFSKARIDFPENSLIVEITDNWYDLNESRQAKLGNEILKRSRQLSFSKLQLEDSVGILVARNPVVGDNIILLQTNKAK